MYLSDTPLSSLSAQQKASFAPLHLKKKRRTTCLYLSPAKHDQTYREPQHDNVANISALGCPFKALSAPERSHDQLIRMSVPASISDFRFIRFLSLEKKAF